MDYGRDSLADALAAEYVAGTLRGAARRRFERLLPAHPVLQHAVYAWQNHLLPLTAAVEPQSPPQEVWNGIVRRLWPAHTTAPAPWWQRLALWRALAGVGGAAALALGMMVANPPAAGPPVVVVLQATEAAGAAVAGIVASVSADGRALTTRPVQRVTLTPRQALELWAVPTQGAPRSLGLISSESASVVPRERLGSSLLGGRVAALAVTLEPPGGSPTGAPTGPIVYLGRL